MHYAAITERLKGLGSDKWLVHIEGKRREARGEKLIFLRSWSGAARGRSCRRSSFSQVDDVAGGHPPAGNDQRAVLGQVFGHTFEALSR